MGSKLTYEDFNQIIQRASKIYKEKSFPIKIQKKEILAGYAPQYCVVLAVIELLNKKGFLKEIPEFKD